MEYRYIGKAIGAFERTLVTPSRYDKFLQGDSSALTKEEKEGLKTFIESFTLFLQIANMRELRRR